VSFEVISEVYGAPVGCSFCARAVKRVVGLPIVDHTGDRPSADPELEGRFTTSMFLCAYCVLEMAKALAAAEGVA
jgi:hypothetical protein